MQLDNFTRQYIVTALWSSTDENGDSLDNFYGISDLSTELLKQIVQDCNDFRLKGAELIEQALLEQDETTIAHDFWLTRNGHGAGFWDGDYNEKLGKALTILSATFNEVHLIAEDGKIYG